MLLGEGNTAGDTSTSNAVCLDTAATITMLCPHFFARPLSGKPVQVVGINKGRVAATNGSGLATMSFSTKSSPITMGLRGSHCHQGPRNILSWSHLLTMVPGARLASAGDTLHVHIPGENSPVIFTQAHRPGLFTTLAHKVGKPARHGITSSSAAAVYNVHTHAPDNEGTHVTDGAHPNRATDANSARGAEATQPNQVQHTLRPEVNQRAKLDALLYSSSPPRQKTEYRRAPAGKIYSAAKSTGDPFVT